MPPRFGGAPKCPRCEKSVYMAEQVLGPGGQWHNWCLTCKECNKRLDSTTLTEKDNEAYCRTCYTRKWGPKGYGFAGGAAFLSTENKMPSEVLEENDLKPPTTTSRQQFNASAPPPPPRQMTPPRQITPPLPQKTTPPLPARQPTLPPRQQQSSSPSLPARPSVESRPEIPTRPNIVSPSNDHHPDEEKDEEDHRNVSSSFNEPTKSNTSNSGYISHQTSYVPRKFNFAQQNDICTGCGKAVYAAELVLGAGNKYHKLCLKCCQCGKRLDSTNMVDKDFDLYCRGCYSKAFGPKGYGYGNLLTPEGATR